MTATRRRPAGSRVQLVASVAAPEPKPMRGVKLKTVSLWTMLFALLCLGAFVAGRPPLSAAGSSEAAGLEQRCGSRAQECAARGTRVLREQ
jgi:hypothetical protein